MSSPTTSQLNGRVSQMSAISDNLLNDAISMAEGEGLMRQAAEKDRSPGPQAAEPARSAPNDPRYDDLTDDEEVPSGQRPRPTGVALQERETAPPPLSGQLAGDQHLHRPLAAHPSRSSGETAHASTYQQAAPRGARPLIPWPDEVQYGSRPAKRHAAAATGRADMPPTDGNAPKRRRSNWTRPHPMEGIHHRGGRVYDNYYHDYPDHRDPRTHPEDRRHRYYTHEGSLRGERDGPAIIPLRSNLSGHTMYDHSSDDGSITPEPVFRKPALTRQREIHGVSPDNSTESRHTDHHNGRDSRASVGSRASNHSPASHHTQATHVSRASVHSLASTIQYRGQGAPNPTPPPVVAPHVVVPPVIPPVVEVRANEEPAPIFGPQNFHNLLDDIELPHTEPMDAVAADCPLKVKRLFDAIYTNPPNKEKLAGIYTKYPRPTNLDVVHKTRLNPDIAKELVKRGHSAVVNRDDPLRSIQWALQFLVRPLAEVLEHLTCGDKPDPKMIVDKTIDAIKLAAKASFKINDLRRTNLSAGLVGAGLDILNAHGAHGFQFLLGENARELAVARQREAESIQEIIAPAPRSHRPAGRQGENRGNGRSGQTRGRSNKQQGRKNNNHNNNKSSTNKSGHYSKQNGSSSGQSRQKSSSYKSSSKNRGGGTRQNAGNNSNNKPNNKQ